MRRIAMACAPARGVALGACGGGGATQVDDDRGTAAARTAASQHAGDDHAVDRLQRPRARRGQAGRRRLPPVAPVRSRSRWSAASTTTRSSRPSAAATRPTSRSRSPPTTPALFCSSGGWIDLKPYMDATKIDASMFPQARADVHAVQGQALRAADARRHLRPLLQQGPLQEGRHHRAAEDDVRADRGRQEADRARRRQLQGRRLRPGPGLLRERARALRRRCSARSGSTASGKSVLASSPAGPSS